MTDKKQIAKEGELRFASEFLRQNWNVFLPYGEDKPVDLLIEKDGEFKKIQIKTTRSKNGIISGRLKSSNNWQVKKYSKKDIDYFGVYDHSNKKGYLLPIEDFEGRTDVNLRLDQTKNNQSKNVTLAKKYEYF